jgi:hypothetical protein
VLAISVSSAPQAYTFWRPARQKPEARSQKRRDPARRPGAELLQACSCSACWCLVLALVLAVAVSTGRRRPINFGGGWRAGEAEARNQKSELRAEVSEGQAGRGRGASQEPGCNHSIRGEITSTGPQAASRHRPNFPPPRQLPATAPRPPLLLAQRPCAPQWPAASCVARST